MKVSIGIGGAFSGQRRDFDEQVEYVVEAEKLGIDAVWSAEAWGQDAIAPLAYLAARTGRIRLGTGIMQISARVPAMTAMTALTMAAISNDRFILGLGTSGPQVVEGLQGQPFKAPLTRLKETVEIIKLALAGEKNRVSWQTPRIAAAGRTRQGAPVVTTRQFQHSYLFGDPETPSVGIYRCRGRWLARHVVYARTRGRAS